MRILKPTQQEHASEQRGMPVEIVADSQSVQDVSGETVQLNYYSSGTLTADAGQAAGTVVVGKLANAGVLNDLGDVIGTFKDTSLSFTSTALTTEVAFPYLIAEANDDDTGTNKADRITDGFANGEYCVDCRTGTIYGVKTATTFTLTSTGYKMATTATATPKGSTAASHDSINNAERTQEINPFLAIQQEITGITQLTAPGDTAEVLVNNYGVYGYTFTVASIDTNVIVNLEGSIEQSNYAELPLKNTAVTTGAISSNRMTITANGTYVIYSDAPMKDVRFNWVSESGGTAATIDTDFFGRRA